MAGQPAPLPEVSGRALATLVTPVGHPASPRARKALRPATAVRTPGRGAAMSGLRSAPIRRKDCRPMIGTIAVTEWKVTAPP